MDPITPPSSSAAQQDLQQDPQQALRAALGGLLHSVAELAVARGLPFDAVQDHLKQAFVQAAAQAHPGLAEHRKVSRISTTTGINRREVTRITQLLADAAQQGPEGAAPRSRSVASEAFTHWRSQPPYIDADGRARALPRLGAAPSFETLAQGVTRDVHPRSLLDELCRLGLAQWDTAADTVQLVAEPFVPKGDQARLLGYLGDNVGDHLRAAVANVLGDGRLHFEQAVYADGLSGESIASMRPAIAAQWQGLLQALVPALEERVQADATLQPGPAGRLRVGLYSYHEGAALPDAALVASGGATSPKPPRRAGKRPAKP